MAQGFDPNVPVSGSALSLPLRINFNALFTTNSGIEAPANPDIGTLWIDTNDPDNIKLKWYNGTTFITMMEHLESTPQAISGQSTFVQPFVSATTVIVTHSLNRFPSVTVVDNTNSVILPDNIVYDNANQITITFDVPTTGQVFIN